MHSTSKSMFSSKILNEFSVIAQGIEIENYKNQKKITLFEKEKSENVFEQLKNELEKCKLQFNTCNFSTYLKLFTFTNLVYQKEHLSHDKKAQLSLARIQAIKLTILFVTFDKAIEYLIRFEKHNPNTRQLVHEACLFSIPENCNLSIWQSIISQHSPSDPNDLIIRILPWANKIERYVHDNRQMLYRVTSQFAVL